MAGRLNRGEIWLLALARPDKRRPVLVLSRPSLIGLLHTVTVAAVTSTRRGSPTEVALGPDEGLRAESCVNLCNLSKRFKTWGSQSVEGLVDLFNTLNVNTITNQTNRNGSTYLQPTEIIAPRVFRVGVRYKF